MVSLSLILLVKMDYPVSTLYFPSSIFIMGIATMFATGGSAIVAKKMGEGKKEEANQNFTFLFVVLMAVGALVTIGVLVFIDPLLSFPGSHRNLIHIQL